MIKLNHKTSDYTVISQHTVAEVWFNKNTSEHSLHSLRHFAAGDKIVDFAAAELLNSATYLTIQTGKHRHITLSPQFLQYINHSCNPNVFFDTGNMQLICLQVLQPADEMRFFYPSTEWDISQPFVCNCGCSNCLQLVNGAANLSSETLAKYRLSDFIMKEIEKR